MPYRLSKPAARIAAKAIRAACDPALGAPMAAHVLREFPLPPGTIIGGFWPLPAEIDITALLHALAERYQVTLPETPPVGNALMFRKWTPGESLQTGRYGTKHSTGPVLVPDFILAPLLAFDANGNRLGYGGGYYDRSFAALPNAFRLGCAFAAQELAVVPVAAEDLPLHAVATELGVRRF